MAAPKFNYHGFRPDLSMSMDRFDLQADQMGFVGLKIAPAKEVSMQAGEFKVRDIEDILVRRETLRTNDGSYSRGELRFTKDSFATEEHGFEVRIDEREQNIHRSYVDLEQEGAMHARDVVLRNHNDRVIQAALNLPGGQQTAAGTAWSTIATADPVANIRAAKIEIRKRTGLIANAVCFDWEAYEYLRDNEKIRDRAKEMVPLRPGQTLLGIDLLRAALDVEFVFISGAMTNSATQPEQANLASMWDRTKALVFVRRDGNTLQQPQYMRTLHWGEDGSSIGGVFDRYYSEERRSEIVRQRMDTQEKVLYQACAQLITGVLA